MLWRAWDWRRLRPMPGRIAWSRARASAGDRLGVRATRIRAAISPVRPCPWAQWTYRTPVGCVEHRQAAVTRSPEEPGLREFAGEVEHAADSRWQSVTGRQPASHDEAVVDPMPRRFRRKTGIQPPDRLSEQPVGQQDESWDDPHRTVGALAEDPGSIAGVGDGHQGECDAGPRQQASTQPCLCPPGIAEEVAASRVKTTAYFMASSRRYRRWVPGLGCSHRPCIASRNASGRAATP